MSDDDEVLEKYTRARVKGGVMVVEVAVVHWDKQRPRLSWVEVRHLIETVSSAVAQSARRSVLMDPAYFVVCPECSGRCPLGQIRDRICHSCEQNEQAPVH
jgi:hypothetical protein